MNIEKNTYSGFIADIKQRIRSAQYLTSQTNFEQNLPEKLKIFDNEKN